VSRALGLLVLFSLLPLQAARANAEIRIMNTDRSGEGFNDPTPALPVGGNPGTTLGEQRRIAFQHAAALWSATLGNQVRIVVDAQLSPWPAAPTRPCSAWQPRTTSAPTTPRSRR
jgi:hypothetical protein